MNAVPEFAKPTIRVLDKNVVSVAEGRHPGKDIPVCVNIPEAILLKAKHHAIASQSTAVVTQQAIAATINLERIDGACEHAVEESSCIWTSDLQRPFQNIKQINRFTQNPIFISDRAVQDDRCKPPLMFTIRLGLIVCTLEVRRACTTRDDVGLQSCQRLNFLIQRVFPGTGPRRSLCQAGIARLMIASKPASAGRVP